MSNQEKIAAIVQAIQVDANLIAVWRALLTNNISNASDDQLNNIMTLLGISNA